MEEGAQTKRPSREIAALGPANIVEGRRARQRVCYNELDAEEEEQVRQAEEISRKRQRDRNRFIEAEREENEQRATMYGMTYHEIVDIREPSYQMTLHCKKTQRSKKKKELLAEEKKRKKKTMGVVEEEQVMLVMEHEKPHYLELDARMYEASLTMDCASEAVSDAELRERYRREECRRGDDVVVIEDVEDVPMRQKTVRFNDSPDVRIIEDVALSPECVFIEEVVGNKPLKENVRREEASPSELVDVEEDVPTIERHYEVFDDIAEMLKSSAKKLEQCDDSDDVASVTSDNSLAADFGRIEFADSDDDGDEEDDVDAMPNNVVSLEGPELWRDVSMIHDAYQLEPEDLLLQSDMQHFGGEEQLFEQLEEIETEHREEMEVEQTEGPERSDTSDAVVEDHDFVVSRHEEVVDVGGYSTGSGEEVDDGPTGQSEALEEVLEPTDIVEPAMQNVIEDHDLVDEGSTVQLDHQGLPEQFEPLEQVLEVQQASAVADKVEEGSLNIQNMLMGMVEDSNLLGGRFESNQAALHAYYQYVRHLELLSMQSSVNAGGAGTLEVVGYDRRAEDHGKGVEPSGDVRGLGGAVENETEAVVMVDEEPVMVMDGQDAEIYDHEEIPDEVIVNVEPEVSDVAEGLAEPSDPLDQMLEVEEAVELEKEQSVNDTEQGAVEVLCMPRESENRQGVMDYQAPEDVEVEEAVEDPEASLIDGEELEVHLEPSSQKPDDGELAEGEEEEVLEDSEQSEPLDEVLELEEASEPAAHWEPTCWTPDEEEQESDGEMYDTDSEDLSDDVLDVEQDEDPGIGEPVMWNQNIMEDHEFVVSHHEEVVDVLEEDDEELVEEEEDDDDDDDGLAGQEASEHGQEGYDREIVVEEDQASFDDEQPDGRLDHVQLLGLEGAPEQVEEEVLIDIEQPYVHMKPASRSPNDDGQEPAGKIPEGLEVQQASAVADEKPEDLLEPTVENHDDEGVEESPEQMLGVEQNKVPEGSDTSDAVMDDHDFVFQGSTGAAEIVEEVQDQLDHRGLPKHYESLAEYLEAQRASEHIEDGSEVADKEDTFALDSHNMFLELWKASDHLGGRIESDQAALLLYLLGRRQDAMEHQEATAPTTGHSTEHVAKMPVSAPDLEVEKVVVEETSRTVKKRKLDRDEDSVEAEPAEQAEPAECAMEVDEPLQQRLTNEIENIPAVQVQGPPEKKRKKEKKERVLGELTEPKEPQELHIDTTPASAPSPMLALSPTFYQSQLTSLCQPISPPSGSSPSEPTPEVVAFADMMDQPDGLSLSRAPTSEEVRAMKQELWLVIKLQLMATPAPGHEGDKWAESRLLVIDACIEAMRLLPKSVIQKAPTERPRLRSLVQREPAPTPSEASLPVGQKDIPTWFRAKRLAGTTSALTTARTSFQDELQPAPGSTAPTPAPIRLESLAQTSALSSARTSFQADTQQDLSSVEPAPNPGTEGHLALGQNQSEFGAGTSFQAELQPALGSVAPLPIGIGSLPQESVLPSARTFFQADTQQDLSSAVPAPNPEIQGHLSLAQDQSEFGAGTSFQAELQQAIGSIAPTPAPIRLECLAQTSALSSARTFFQADTQQDLNAAVPVPNLGTQGHLALAQDQSEFGASTSFQAELHPALGSIAPTPAPIRIESLAQTSALPSARTFFQADTQQDLSSAVLAPNPEIQGHLSLAQDQFQFGASTSSQAELHPAIGSIEPISIGIGSLPQESALPSARTSFQADTQPDLTPNPEIQGHLAQVPVQFEFGASTSFQAELQPAPGSVAPTPAPIRLESLAQTSALSSARTFFQADTQPDLSSVGPAPNPGTQGHLAQAPVQFEFGASTSFQAELQPAMGSNGLASAQTSAFALSAACSILPLPAQAQNQFGFPAASYLNQSAPMSFLEEPLAGTSQSAAGSMAPIPLQNDVTLFQDTIATSGFCSRAVDQSQAKTQPVRSSVEPTQAEALYTLSPAQLQTLLGLTEPLSTGIGSLPQASALPSARTSFQANTQPDWSSLISAPNPGTQGHLALAQNQFQFGASTSSQAPLQPAMSSYELASAQASASFQAANMASARLVLSSNVLLLAQSRSLFGFGGSTSGAPTSFQPGTSTGTTQPTLFSNPPTVTQGVQSRDTVPPPQPPTAVRKVKPNRAARTRKAAPTSSQAGHLASGKPAVCSFAPNPGHVTMGSVAPAPAPVPAQLGAFGQQLQPAAMGSMALGSMAQASALLGTPLPNAHQFGFPPLTPYVPPNRAPPNNLASMAQKASALPTSFQALQCGTPTTLANVVVAPARRQFGLPAPTTCDRHNARQGAQPAVVSIGPLPAQIGQGNQTQAWRQLGLPVPTSFQAQSTSARAQHLTLYRFPPGFANQSMRDIVTIQRSLDNCERGVEAEEEAMKKLGVSYRQKTVQHQKAQRELANYLTIADQMKTALKTTPLDKRRPEDQRAFTKKWKANEKSANKRHVAVGKKREELADLRLEIAARQRKKDELHREKCSATRLLAFYRQRNPVFPVSN